MLRIDHPDGTAESFTYNALGQILTHTDGKGQTTRLMRNARGLPTRRQDAKGQSIAYEYDKAIRLTALVNENNASYRFAYDASDRLIEEQRIDNLTRRFQYNLGGYLTQVEETGYGERAERPQRHTEFEYEYEANGQLHSRDTGKLVDSEEFRYDAAANRLNFNTSRFDHVKDNRLKQWRDQEYSYDAWGNLVEKRSGLAKWQTFTYDCENRLVKAETLVNSQLHSTGTYQYDSLGRRVAKQSEVNGQTQHKRFLWQGLRMLREEQPGQSSLYVYEPGSYAPLARVDQREGEAENTLYYFHTDQIGTPLEMTDIEGQIVWQATYKAWGSLETLTVNEVEQNLRFQGQYFDEETGLHYNTFRYYDPEVGRFITQDPIGLDGGFNLYGYCRNPVAWIDPLGLDWNYFLTDSNGDTYYHGRASDNASLSDVMRRHGNNVGADGARFGAGDSITQVTPKGTDYNTVRGIENSGVRENPILGRGSVNVRGNTIQGMADNKLSTEQGRIRVSAAENYLEGKGVSKVSALPVIETRAHTVKSATC
ncbi:RHS repeat-associated core domain-containing protein [Pseudomonas alliivorans]|nr:RHS repeat-associated core domain-containing protein [Pseudomonas alliivorans]